MLKSTKEEGGMATPSGFADSLKSNMCFQAVLGFFFNKGVRGGPRVLLNLAAVLVGLFIFLKLLPTRMTENALQRIPLPKTVWSGLSNGESRPGGLRIVVFGELDIGTPVGANPEDDDPKSWTEMICEQFECDTYITMVPTPDTAPWSISSNELYAQGIERVFNETDGQEGPGQDYSYLSKYYPAQWKSKDLKAQIDDFLAMPKGKTPQRTLWVFSFGFWDVWSLSALPVAQGKESVDHMTRDIFEQVERLYTAALDPTSIAYSHTTVIKQVPVEAPSASKAVEQAAVEEQSSEGEKVPVEERAEPEPVQSAAEPATTGSATTPQEENTIDPGTFEVLIPRVVDPSLLPGWRDLRPRIPSVHSKAEQMRNSAMLTVEWNERIADRMIDWVQKEEMEKNADFYIDTPADDAAPTPVRDGFAYNLAEFVIDKILERQMVNAHLKDGNGLGDTEIDEGYRDVRNPCLQAVDVSRVSISGPVVGDVLLNIPNDKIENDMQAPRKYPAAAAGAAVKKRAEFENKPGLAYLSTAKVCDIPDDHLFYTPFALSQRAIWAIANETSDLIRSGESVRTKLGKRTE